MLRSSCLSSWVPLPALLGMGEEELLEAPGAFSALLQEEKSSLPRLQQHTETLPVRLINLVCANAFEPDIEHASVCVAIRQYLLCKLALVSSLRTVFPRAGTAVGGTRIHSCNSTPCINYSSLSAHQLCVATCGPSWPQKSA